MLTAWRTGGHSDPTTLPLHPLLAAAYPILFLFAQNVEDQVTLGPLLMPLGLAMLGSLGTLLVARLLLGDWRRAALLTTLGLALFFTFGHAWNLVADAFVVRRWLIGAYALVGIAGAVLVWRGGRWVPAATRGLNVMLGLLVVLNAVTIGAVLIGASQARAGAAESPVALQAADRPRPDIYYLVFDRYANSQTLREHYDYDNSPFLDELRARGFGVADDAWANYPKTALSLASSLDMALLDPEEMGAAATQGARLVPAYAMLQGPLAAPRALRSIGYQYILVPGMWEPSAANVDADRVFRYVEGQEFSSALVQTTALSLLSPSYVPEPGRVAWHPDVLRPHAEFQFDRLAQIPELSEPTFTFAHFLLPHPPYVFDSDGSVPTRQERAARGEAENYVRQLQYTNGRIISLVDRLLDVPAEDQPVIILMADEGPFPNEFAANEREFDWLEATPEQIQQKMGILNAIHLPGADPAEAGFGPRTSPLNVLRIVLNTYFAAGLPMLPDRIFLSPTYSDVYGFVEVERTADGDPILPATPSP